MKVFLSKSILLQLLLTGLFLLLFSCTKKVETGPGEIRWDRMICERCLMAVSDHYYTAQVRGAPKEKPTKLYYFDDIGCAILWLDKQNWKTDPRVEIWVNDFKTGVWIDAKNSVFEKGKITPMDFGLGATLQSDEPTINFEEAVKQIYQSQNRKMIEMKHKKPSL